MKQIFYSLLIALSFTSNVLPLTINSTVLENKNTGKHVLLLGEMHTKYAKQTLADKEKTLYDTVEQQQKKEFTQLTNRLLALDPQKGAQTVVITEINPAILGSLLEEEAGLVDTQEQKDETVQVMPRLFLKTMLAPAKTVDEKVALFQSSVIPFNDVPAASFIFGNGLRWIAGDTRTEKDKFLSFTVYKHWKSILESISKKEDMPEALSSLTIAHVKEYVKTWHDLFVSHGIADPYGLKIMATIDTAVKAGNLSSSDHIATVHAYLRNHGKIAASDALNNNFIRFTSLKPDLELRMYVESFEKNPMLKYLIIHFGNEHTKIVRNLLRKDGYHVVKQVGCNFPEPKTTNDVKKQTMQALQFLKKTPNLLSAHCQH